MNREAKVAVIVLANAMGSQAVHTEGLALESLDMLSK